MAGYKKSKKMGHTAVSDIESPSNLVKSARENTVICFDFNRTVDAKTDINQIETNLF